MFIENKYTNWYNSIIAKARSENRFKSDQIYYENHHIIPRSIGGTHGPSNLVLLTGREHFLCHWLLTKMVNEPDHVRKMKAAMIYFTNNHKRKLPAYLIKISRKMNGDRKRGLPAWNRGIPHTDETKRKIGVANSRSTLTDNGRKIKSEFTRQMNLNRSDEYNKMIAQKNAKKFIVIDPNGNEYIIVNLKNFCEQHKLNNGCMCSVSKGKLRQYKGWKCREIPYNNENY